MNGSSFYSEILLHGSRQFLPDRILQSRTVCGSFCIMENCVSIIYVPPNARFTCSAMDKSKTVAALRRSRFLTLRSKQSTVLINGKNFVLLLQNKTIDAYLRDCCCLGMQLFEKVLYICFHVNRSFGCVCRSGKGGFEACCLALLSAVDNSIIRTHLNRFFNEESVVC